ncbi:MAG: hypothetical protein ACOYLE_10510 [Bacteroidales bacterium]
MGKLAIFGFVFIIQSLSVVYGQNLLAGNPQLNLAEQTVLSDKELEFSLTYFHSNSNKYFTEDQIFNNVKYIKNAFSNYTEFKSSYGFTPKLSASIELGYFINKTVNYQDSSLNGHGLGDAAVYLKYRLIFSKNAKFTLLPAIGIKIPIGVFDQMDGNAKLPIMVQPSSGNFKYIAGVFMSKVINYRISISSICAYEYAQLIDSKNFYYKYGDQWMLSFFAQYRFQENFSTVLQFRFENKDKSHILINKVVEASGYKIVFVSPQLNYNFNKNYQISASADFPVYRYYNGTQFASGFSFSLRLLKKIDLKY